MFDAGMTAGVIDASHISDKQDMVADPIMAFGDEKRTDHYRQGRF